jgi:hypothetical protein
LGQGGAQGREGGAEGGGAEGGGAEGGAKGGAERGAEENAEGAVQQGTEGESHGGPEEGNRKRKRTEQKEEQNLGKRKSQKEMFLEDQQLATLEQNSEFQFLSSDSEGEELVVGNGDDEWNDEERRDEMEQSGADLLDDGDDSYIVEPKKEIKNEEVVEKEEKEWTSEREIRLVISYSVVISKSSSVGSVKYGMWQDIVNLFNRNTPDFKITNQQARNKFGALKSKYQLLEGIRNHVSGVGWKESTCQIEMPRRAWIDLATGNY